MTRFLSLYVAPYAEPVPTSRRAAAIAWRVLAAWILIAAAGECLLRLRGL